MVSTFWTKGGKPDYAKSASWIASLSPDIREKINHTDELVLREVVLVSHASALKQRDGKARVYFSQGWLAEAVGKSVRTVQRSLTKLVDLGLIEMIRRRPDGDCWKTNLTRLGKRLLSLFYRLFSKKSNVSAYDKSVVQEPKEKVIEGPSREPSIKPKEISTHEAESDMPFELDAQGNPIRVAGERQVKSGWLTQAMLQHRSTAAKEVERKKLNSEEELRRYWEQVGYSGLPIRG